MIEFFFFNFRPAEADISINAEIFTQGWQLTY